VIITIDSPGFNFRLAGMLKKNPAIASIKRIHYVAPSVWAYKPGRARKTARLFDLLLALLPFEPPYFDREGLKTMFVGHPVLWESHKGDGAAFRARHGIAADEKLLLVLPGSRAGEVKRHLPVFLAAAKSMTEFKTVILAASQVKHLVQNAMPPGCIVCSIEEKQDAFAAATLALSKSGTVTLELAVAGVPMVVAYKVSPLSAWLIRRMIRVKYASLVNIAVNAEIVPERIQERCTVEEIAKTLMALSSPAAMKQQQADCAHALSILRGDNQVSPNLIAAKAVLDVLPIQAQS
jgi:lipid-A-disaccharide synthase